MEWNRSASASASAVHHTGRIVAVNHVRVFEIMDEMRIVLLCLLVTRGV